MEERIKLRLFSQLCILGYAAVTAVALCDLLDKKSDERRMLEMIPEKAPVYYSEARVFPDVAEICDIDSNDNYDTYDYQAVDYEDNLIDFYESTDYYTDFEIENAPYTESHFTYSSLEIPYGETDVYLYMDYTAITAVDTPQYELQQWAYTNELGIREYDGCYCVAMSERYGDVGQKLRVTTDLGNVYNVVIADIKGYDSVDGWYHTTYDGRINLIEFVVDTYWLDSFAVEMGDCGVIPEIGGNVVSIERID